MTQFIAAAAAECPPELRPDWMVARHRLSTPDVIQSTKDPAIRQRWVEDAEWGRDQTPRPFRLQLRRDGRVLRRWDLDVSPSVAWWWLVNTSREEGCRLVLVDPSKPNLLDEPCDCGETRPSLAYDVHKHQEAGS